MKVTILGAGGAGGVPMLSVGWGACDPAEPKNQRTRPSILVEDQQGDQTTCVLVDTSPDLRQQLLRENVRSLDGILFTHAHADHTHGIDDIREVNRAMGRSIPCWSDAQTLAGLKERFDYCFLGVEEGQPIFRPWLVPNPIVGPFRVGSIPVTSWEQDHGWGTSLGFRFGPIAYTTDALRLPEEAFAAIEGVKVWIIGTLTDKPHVTHAHVDLAIEWSHRIKPEKTILTHMGPGLDYQTLCQSLPEGVIAGYDGMVIDTDAL